MQKFIKRFLIFLIFPAVIIATDLLSPVNAFTFRQWEALQFNYPYFSNGAFYPNQQITMTEVGDLGRHTPYEIKKITTWQTDMLGFRNDRYIPNADILLVGDSFFTGSSLTQDSTITNMLQQRIDTAYPGKNYTVYNISPNTFDKIDFYLKSNLLKKPRLIVFSVAERSVGALAAYHEPAQLSLKDKVTNSLIEIIPRAVPVYMDRLVKQNFLRYLSVKVNPRNLYNFFTGKTNPGNAMKKEPVMLFLNAGHSGDHPDIVSPSTIAALASYQSYCDKMGIRLIVVAIPEKETVYYEMNTGMYRQSKYLLNLDTSLQKNNIRALPVLKIYNEAKQLSPGRLLYQYDDTHWNEYGVRIVADELIKSIQLEPFK